MKRIIKAGLLCILLASTALFLPPFIPRPVGAYEANVILPIVLRTIADPEHDPNHFSVVGTTPYINAIDYPTNYIGIGGSISGASEDYHFQNLPPRTENITSILLYLNRTAQYGGGGSTSTVAVAPWNASYGWDDINSYKYPSQVQGVNYWEVDYVDLMQFGHINDVASVNGLQVYWIHSTPKLGTAPTITLDYAYLNVTCDLFRPWSAVDQYVWIFMFLGAVFLMIASPTWVALGFRKARASSKTFHYGHAMEQFGYGMLLFLLGLGLLLAFIYH